MALPIYTYDSSDFPKETVALKRRLGELQGLAAPSSDGGALAVVRDIITAVRQDGDAALLKLTEKFDGCRLAAENLRVTKDEIDRAVESLPDDLMGAIHAAAERIRRFQKAILLIEFFLV